MWEAVWLGHVLIWASSILSSLPRAPHFVPAWGSCCELWSERPSLPTSPPLWSTAELSLGDAFAPLCAGQGFPCTHTWLVAAYWCMHLNLSKHWIVA